MNISPASTRSNRSVLGRPSSMMFQVTSTDDVALGFLLDGPLEGVETVAVGALTWPVAPNPQCFPAHPDIRGRCRGGSCLLWSIIDRI